MTADQSTTRKQVDRNDHSKESVRMPISRDAIRCNAVAFSKRWQDVGSEKSDGQNFMRAFLTVFGIATENVGTFEEKALRREGKRGFADYLWPGRIAIEMKSKGKDLDEAYLQLEEYILSLAPEKIPDLIC